MSDYSFDNESATRRAATKRRHQAATYLIWLGLLAVGAFSSLILTWFGGPVERLGDLDTIIAGVGVLVVLFGAIPGFSLFQLSKQRSGRNWYEPVWRPAMISKLLLALAFGSSVWHVLMIADRISRDLG